MNQQILLGIDIGTSDSKVLATTFDGDDICVVSRPTRWTTLTGGQVETDGIALVDAVIELAAEAVRRARTECGEVTVAGIAVTGMAESGVLLSSDGGARSPVIAWFDPRGGEQLERVAPELLSALPAVTGLPVGSQLTLAKLLWLQDNGLDLRGLQFLHVPELIIHRLGGRRAAEISLLARTGLFDQGTGQLWPEALAALNCDQQLFPPLVTAGTPLGTAGGEHCPDELRGATLTIAGHDHPVAAVGCGAIGPEVVFDSFGTAQVFVQTLDIPVAPEQRARLVAGGVNAVRHAVPGYWHLLAGTKAGLMMRRALQLLGAADPAARARLDEQAVTADCGDISVTGAENTDGVLQITAVGDDVSPAALWAATVQHGIDIGTDLLAVMAKEVGPARATVVAGGWIKMASVRRRKTLAVPSLQVSERTQAGAFGATAFARAAHLDVSENERPAALLDYTTHRFARPTSQSVHDRPKEHTA